MVSRGTTNTMSSEGSKMIEIEDNFLGQEELDMIQNTLMGVMFPWYYQPTIDSYEDIEDKDKYQFTHIFYANMRPTSDNAMGMVNPILIKMGSILIWRIKANLLTKTPNIIENKFHIDMFEGQLKVMKQLTTLAILPI